MDAYKKWFDGIQRDDEVPEVVKNVVEKSDRCGSGACHNRWRCAGGESVLGGKTSGDWKHLSAGRERGGLLW